MERVVVQSRRVLPMRVAQSSKWRRFALLDHLGHGWPGRWRQQLLLQGAHGVGPVLDAVHVHEVLAQDVRVQLVLLDQGWHAPVNKDKYIDLCLMALEKSVL